MADRVTTGPVRIRWMTLPSCTIHILLLTSPPISSGLLPSPPVSSALFLGSPRLFSRLVPGSPRADAGRASSLCLFYLLRKLLQWSSAPLVVDTQQQQQWDCFALLSANPPPSRHPRRRIRRVHYQLTVAFRWIIHVRLDRLVSSAIHIRSSTSDQIQMSLT